MGLGQSEQTVHSVCIYSAVQCTHVLLFLLQCTTRVAQSDFVPHSTDYIENVPPKTSTLNCSTLCIAFHFLFLPLSYFILISLPPVLLSSLLFLSLSWSSSHFLFLGLPLIFSFFFPLPIPSNLFLFHPMPYILFHSLPHTTIFQSLPLFFPPYLSSSLFLSLPLCASL